MKRRSRLVAISVITLGVVAVVGSWIWRARPPREIPAAPEVAIAPIALSGGPERTDAEISGLAWFGDQLVLLPQYPERFESAIFAVPRTQIEAAIDRRSERAIAVRRVPLEAIGLEAALPGFDGFEAITFVDDDVYVSIETRLDPDHTVGYLLRGHVEGALERVVIDVSQRARLAAPTDLPNTGYEAIVVHGDRVLALYEANGDVNPHPRVLAFDRALAPVSELHLARLEYRVTDATEVDEHGHFWVANYHWPGSPWQPGECRITQRHGRGASHARCNTVERLVELRVTDTGIAPTRRAPILLELIDDLHARNWEGIVRLGDRGFLLATDEHPASILAFVPAP